MYNEFDTKFENVSKFFQNLDLIGNARIDSVMYDLAPAHTGRRGRPAKHGKRLSVETSYYEQKTFWSFCNYMVRSCKWIEMLVNLINISYCAMKILPYQNEHFSEYRAKSVQEFRFKLSKGIRFVIINNYLAFYTIDEEKQTVIIVRFLYQKSNWTSILRQISPSFNHYSSHQILVQARILARCSHKFKNAVQSSQIVLHFLNTGGFFIFCYNLM